MKKKTYEITYSNKMTFNLGDYSNINPMYALKKVIETDEDINIDREFEEMKGIVDDQLKQNIEKIKQDKLIADLKHIRFYEKDGVKYPSVTSVLNPDPLDVPNIELYGLRGDICHRWFSEIVTTGKSEFFASDAEREKLAPIGGLDGFDLSWIMNDRQFEFDRSEVECFNYQDRYAGRYDADGLFTGKTALFDVKSGDLSKQGLEKAFMQLSAYAKCLPDIKQLVVIPCNPKAKKVAVVNTDIDKYYGLFMAKRKEFNERFGI